GVVHAGAGMTPTHRFVLVFVDREDLQPRTLGIVVSGDHRIAVTESDGVKALAVVVDGHRAVNDLVPAVGIDVADGKIVSAHAGEGRSILVGGHADAAVEHPAALQLFAIPVPGRHHRSSVDAADVDDARVNA